MAAVAVGLQVVLAAPELPAAEAQPDQARRHIGLDPRQPGPQVVQPARLLMDPVPVTLLPGASQLPAGPADQALQGLDMQKLPPDSRTALNIRAGMPYSLTQEFFTDAADLPEETSAKRRLCTLPYRAA